MRIRGMGDGGRRGCRIIPPRVPSKVGGKGSFPGGGLGAGQ